MDKKKIEKNKQTLESLRRELCELGPLMRGSVVLIGKPYKQYYFSLNKDKKTHLIFLGKKRVERAKEFSENYKKLLTIVEEMTTINMKLLKDDIEI